MKIINILLLQLFGPGMFVMSLNNIATIVYVLSAALDICFQKVSFSSIVTPRYCSAFTLTI